MKIYSITRNDASYEFGVYGCFHGHVVVASTLNEAISLVVEEGVGEEGEEAWSEGYVEIEEMGVYRSLEDIPHIVLSDFTNG